MLSHFSSLDEFINETIPKDILSNFSSKFFERNISEVNSAEKFGKN